MTAPHFAIAKQYGQANALRQYRQNLAQLRECSADADAIAPRKYRGQTALYWADMVTKYEQIVAELEALDAK